MSMFRAMQNPDTPNLPFAQMYRVMQNPDTPDLPFAQRPNPRDNTTCYEIFGTEMQLTNEAAQYYRNIGQTLTPCSSTPPPTPSGNGWTKSQIENIIVEYHGDDVALLHSHAVNFGKVQTKAKIHRDSIEGKVEKNISAFPDINTKLSNLGKSVSDVSAGLTAHSTHDLIPNPFGDIPTWLILGGVGLLLVMSKKRRN